MVRCIFVPVSPSGTGKTLSALTSPTCCSSQIDAACSPASSWAPFQAVVVLCVIPNPYKLVLLGTNALHMNVDRGEGSSQRFLQRIVHGRDHLLGHLRDARTVGHHDMNVNRDRIAANVYTDPAVL